MRWFPSVLSASLPRDYSWSYARANLRAPQSSPTFSISECCRLLGREWPPWKKAGSISFVGRCSQGSTGGEAIHIVARTDTFGRGVQSRLSRSSSMRPITEVCSLPRISPFPQRNYLGSSCDPFGVQAKRQTWECGRYKSKVL